MSPTFSHVMITAVIVCIDGKSDCEQNIWKPIQKFNMKSL